MKGRDYDHESARRADPYCKSEKDLSKEQEKRVARKIGGRRQPASGALPGIPNDVSSDEFLIECKRTKYSGMGIKGEWIQKLDEVAIMHGKTPCLELEFDGLPDGTTKHWMMVPFDYFCERMIEGT
jgi:Holliday junction resolvase